MTTEERFWSKVDKSGDCWLWMAAVNRRYGSFGLRDGHQVRAHRYAYEITKGPIPDGMVVMHSCDTPLCVNPAHLSIGTQIDNNEDMTRKGRRARGERIPQAKLTPDAVREIRRSTGTLKSVAARFGVAFTVIHKIRKGESWRHVQ